MCGSGGSGPHGRSPRTSGLRPGCPWAPATPTRDSTLTVTPPSLPPLSLTPQRMEPGPSCLQPSMLLASGNCPKPPCVPGVGGQGRGGAGRVCGSPARSSGCCPVWPQHAPRGPGLAAGTKRRALGLGVAGGPTAKDGDRRPPVSPSPLAQCRPIRKLDPGQGLQGPAGSTSPLHRDHCQGSPGQGSPRWLGQVRIAVRSPGARALSPQTPCPWRLLQSRSQEAQVLNFQSRQGASPRVPRSA